MDAAQEPAGTAADLHVRVPAIAEQLHSLRRALRTWAIRVGMTGEVITDLVLAAYEAMANVVDHAYCDRIAGLLDLHAHADPAHRTVIVTVTDNGCWRRPPPGPTTRGRGLRLIRELSRHTKVSPSQHGTIVAMTYQLV
jgi:serine/threonine-protein kinase RsbW